MNIFALMAKRPWPFMIVIPIILIVFTAVGWTREDIVEDHVYNIWAPTRTEFSKDKAYSASLGETEASTSTFAAMAIARDGGNLFTERRLEAIRARMEQVEATTVEYKGNIFTIDDVCSFNNVGALGTTYKFPCIRLSIMDLFQEAGFYFEEDHRVTFYNEMIRKLLVKPRIPRFGIMTQVCTSTGNRTESSACDRIVALRTNGTFAEEEGFPPSYNNSLLLLEDVGTLEMNDPCKICIEENFEKTMQQYTSDITKMFDVLSSELKRAIGSGTVPEADVPGFEALAQQMDAIIETVDRTAVEEWYSYYIIRSLYVELGAGPYASTYATFMQIDERLQFLCTIALGDATKCPLTVTIDEAKQHLADHADNTFSSVSTAGAPFPFWSEANGTGYLFAGTFPVSGSGVDMSGTLLSAATYLDLDNFGILGGDSSWSPRYTGSYIDPLTPNSTWEVLVETDPIYRWFVAGVTNMTSHCGNANLTGTNIDAIIPGTDELTAEAAGAITPRWCTKYNVPFEEDGTRTQQFFAKMWFELLVDSDAFLGITQGVNTPYDWTTGNGCGYSLGGTREPYTGRNDSSILFNASRILYNIDEGVTTGALDRNSIMGGTTPAIGEYNMKDNPLTEVRVIQNIYPALIGESVPDRVRNCNRPSGPLELTEEESKELLKLWKEAFEDSWTEGWDDPDSGEVQFVGFFDDVGDVGGTTGRLLLDITLDNGKLTAISIILIAVFSAIFLFSFDVIDSKVLVTLVGVGLVILSFFSALGLGILCGIKVSINIAWTLPFIILGIGVDDMYIVLLSLKSTGSYTEENFVESMMEVVVPVAMTSLVNLCMFATMQFVDIPAVALTAQMALISVIFLFLTILFSFPAYCYLDMKRQAAGRYDCFVCIKKEPSADADVDHPVHISWLYTLVYKRLVLGKGIVTICVRVFIALATASLIGVGIYGITQRKVGLGFEDFFPASSQAHVWATEAAQSVSAWGINVRWGEEDYQDPDTQLFIVRQFEQIIETPNVAEIDTKFLWLASFNIWMSRHCTTNFDRDDPGVLECGRDQVFPEDNTTCAGYWTPNKYGAREKNFGDGEQCLEYEGGICRPTSQMHPEDLEELGIDSSNPGVDPSWCPVFANFTDDKLQFCLMRWHNFTGGGGGLIQQDDTRTPNPECEGEYYNDAVIDVPILYTQGPNCFANDLQSHEDYIELIAETRAVCDDVERVRCWLTGIPYNYWEQYLYIESVLLQASFAAVGVGFGVSLIFLFVKLKREGEHSTSKIFLGSFFGALLIAMTCTISLVAVVGISALLNINLTAFSAMSFLLSVGFAIEYSVHVVHRYMNAPLAMHSPGERVEYAMSFLTLPTFMSFVSSTIGVVCLAFTEFEFNRTFFFKPLLTVMFVTYFVGCWFLPVLLAVANLKALNCGSSTFAKGSIPDDLVLHEEEGSPKKSPSTDKDPDAAGELEQPSSNPADVGEQPCSNSPDESEQTSPDPLDADGVKRGGSFS